MTGRRPLEMSIDSMCFEHLGMNLYSNMPAVLSEIVANAWDADAKSVDVTLDKASERIVIQDTGTGMTRDEVIDRFLTVGFKRRELRPMTPGGRRPMGRKGLGKLSIFSVAQIADIYTVSDGERTAFRMDREVIRKSISKKEDEPYRPEEIIDWPPDLSAGTRIVLSGLSKTISTLTVNGLASHRATVLRHRRLVFVVTVNGTKIGPEDRGYHDKIEYLWTYGSQQTFVNMCNKPRPPVGEPDNGGERCTQEVEAEADRMDRNGGESRSELKDEEGDNLNRIAIFMRGKLAQEDVLDESAKRKSMLITHGRASLRRTRRRRRCRHRDKQSSGTQARRPAVRGTTGRCSG